MTMTKEDKQLLLQDLCARLPYGVILQLTIWDDEMSNAHLTGIDEDGDLTADVPADCAFNIEDVKPYLRPMSSMTEEEIDMMWNISENYSEAEGSSKITDLLNKWNLDHHHLIERGLAIAVTKENNPYK